MSENPPFLILDHPGAEAINWVIRQINSAGLRVVRTFDLQVARHEHANCLCPYHGTEHCDCQMVVLLVYGSQHQPISIIAHSYEGQTWFSMVDSPEQRAAPQLEATIRGTLIPTYPVFKPINQPHEDR